MNRQDQMVQFSQLYPDAYTQIVTQQGLYPKSTKYFILYTIYLKMVEKYKVFELPFFGCIFWMRIKAFKRTPIIKTFQNPFFFSIALFYC